MELPHVPPDSGYVPSSLPPSQPPPLIGTHRQSPVRPTDPLIGTHRHNVVGEGVPPDSDEQSGLAGSALGRVFQDTFIYDEQTVGTEEVTRTNTVDLLVRGLAGRKEYLDARLERSENAARMSRMRSGNLERARELEANGSTWAGSASFRNQVAQASAPEIAYNEYLPLLPNLREHTVVGADGRVLSRLNRSGAIHDYRYGHTNLEELRSIRQFITAGGQWGLPLPQCNTLVRLDSRFEKMIFTDKDWDGVLLLLDEHIADRAYVLENQALQDLSLHFQSMTPEEMSRMPEEVLFGRVSLLNGFNPAKQGKGWEINERNQILDMAAVYTDLSGKTLVFDGKGPFVDDEGRIHLPQEVLDAQGAPLTRTFKPLFFNISAQGDIRNEGPQKEINAKGFAELEKLVTQRHLQLLEAGDTQGAARLWDNLLFVKSQLDKKVTDGVELAEQVVLLLQEVNSKVSINCFSGKDRTGLLAAQVTHFHLGRELRRRFTGIESTKARKILGRWGHQLLHPSGIACRVVEDNTTFRALKLTLDVSNKLLSIGTRMQRLIGTKKKVEQVWRAGLTFVTEGQGKLGGGMIFPDQGAVAA